MNFLIALFFSITQPVIINVQPFSGISDKEVNYVITELKKVYPYVKLKPSIAFPKSTVYNNRHRADLLIKYLSDRTQNGHVTIGLTTGDISTSKGKIYDWGIMGLGYKPGKACIASNFRLSKSDRYNQLFKVAIHELGHTQGLPHCPKKGCFMQDAKGKNLTSSEHGFCSSCKSFLVTKGWRF